MPKKGTVGIFSSAKIRDNSYEKTKLECEDKIQDNVGKARQPDNRLTQIDHGAQRVRDGSLEFVTVEQKVFHSEAAAERLWDGSRQLVAVQIQQEQIVQAANPIGDASSSTGALEG